MIGICQNIIKQTTGFFLFSDNKKAHVSAKNVQMVKAEEGSPKSSSLLYLVHQFPMQKSFFHSLHCLIKNF